MARAYYSRVLEFHVDTVWGVVSDFHRISDWVAKLTGFEIEGDVGVGAVGSIRRLTLANGMVAREQLVAYDQQAMTYSYEFPADFTPFPVRSYRATIRLLPIIESGHTFIEWYGDFDSDADIEQEMHDAFMSRYVEFSANLVEYLAAAAA